MKTILIAAAALSLAAPALAHNHGSAGEHDPKAVFGTWMVESGSAHVTIVDCGDGTPCGTLSDIMSESGKTALDDQNPDPELAKKPLLGSRMLWGFEEKKDKWSGGRIYDAQSGKDYKSKIEVNEDGTLKVKGCVGPFCQSQTWTRVTQTNR